MQKAELKSLSLDAQDVIATSHTTLDGFTSTAFQVGRYCSTRYFVKYFGDVEYSEQGIYTNESNLYRYDILREDTFTLYTLDGNTYTGWDARKHLDTSSYYHIVYGDDYDAAGNKYYYHVTALQECDTDAHRKTN